MSLVKNNGQPADFVQLISTHPQLGIVENKDVELIVHFIKIQIVAGSQNLQFEIWGKFPSFGCPNIKNRLWTNHKSWTNLNVRIFGFINIFPQPKKISDTLNRFTKTHVISKYSTKTIRGEIGKELVTLDLIGT